MADETKANEQHLRQDAVCPFCGESGFDFYGLRNHLDGFIGMMSGNRIICDAEATCSAEYERLGLPK